MEFRFAPFRAAQRSGVAHLAIVWISKSPCKSIVRSVHNHLARPSWNDVPEDSAR